MEANIKYYILNSEKFILETKELDMMEIYHRFCSLLPAQARVMDLGCGSGRDSLYFKNKSYQVLAVDIIEEFLEYTKEYAGVETMNLSFSEINFDNQFDGIWACASLLHERKENLSNLLFRLIKSLRNNGVIYCSFKYGNFSGLRNGRYFTDLDEDSFVSLLPENTNARVISLWTGNDNRKERENEKWLNVLLQKFSDY